MNHLSLEELLIQQTQIIQGLGLYLRAQREARHPRDLVLLSDISHRALDTHYFCQHILTDLR